MQRGRGTQKYGPTGEIPKQIKVPSDLHQTPPADKKKMNGSFLYKIYMKSLYCFSKKLGLKKYSLLFLSSEFQLIDYMLIIYLFFH